MKSYLIKDIKALTAGLFSGEMFDSFLLVEAEFITDTTLRLDGHINKWYYDQDETPEEEYACWSSKKPLIFQVVKGKRLPLSFKLVFCLNKKNLLSTLAASGTGFNASDVSNFYINVSYKNNIITVTSGLSMNTFSMDRSLPDYWDTLVERFLKKNNIGYE